MIKKILKEVLDYAKVIVLAILIATIISTQVFTFSQVQQSSMEKTLIEKDALFIQKITYHFKQPERGDIVVLLKGDDVNTTFFGKIKRLYEDMYLKVVNEQKQDRLVKRVIGLPGDEINLVEGKVYINGTLYEENYVTSDTYASIQMPLTVPEGQVFLMGDNRAVSEDSRSFGCVDIKQIEGKATFRLFPLSKFGIIK